jgi:hypothetical protein
MCRRNFGSKGAIFIFLCAFILFFLARNVMLCPFMFISFFLCACYSNKMFLVRETSGYCWAILKIVGWLKVDKLY